MSAFSLESVSKRYAGATALDETSLAIEKSRCTVLIGPSGAGKSTLLRILLGLVWPDTGQVSFEGEVLRPEKLQAMRQRMGYVVQSGGLFPHMTAQENITLMARQRRWAKAEIADRVHELCTLTRFPESALDRVPKELSGGQCQRVSLMRALMLDPSVLLLDEPLGALDPMIRFDLQNDLREIFQTLGKTVVMVTHDLSEAGFLGDDIVLFRAGGIEQQGSLTALVETPVSDFVQRFVAAQRSSPLDAL